jgi:hypothetical protein
MTHRPVGAGSSIAINATSAQSSAFSVQSNVLRVVSVGNGAHVAIGTNPTATTTDYYIPAGKSETLALTKASNRVVGITTGTTTIVTFAEGTQCPFGVGDYVTLSGAQSYYNALITHQPVISVDTSSGVDGYHQTRCSIGTNTSGISTAFSGTNASLKNSLKVAARTDTGSAVLHLQQVQISGQA